MATLATRFGVANAAMNFPGLLRRRGGLHRNAHGDTRKPQGRRGEGKDARQHPQRHEKSEGCEQSGERVAPLMSHSTREFCDLRVVNVISYTKMRWKCVKARCGVAEAHKTIQLREKSHCGDEGWHLECVEEGNERGAEESEHHELSGRNAESGRNCRIRESRVRNAESGESNAEESQISVRNAKWGGVNAE